MEGGLQNVVSQYIKIYNSSKLEPFIKDRNINIVTLVVPLLWGTEIAVPTAINL